MPILAGKAGRLGGFSISFLILLFYYIVMIFGENLSKAGRLNPVVAAWGANLIFGFIAIYLFLRASKEKPIFMKGLTKRSRIFWGIIGRP